MEMFLDVNQLMLIINTKLLYFDQCLSPIPGHKKPLILALLLSLIYYNDILLQIMGLDLCIELKLRKHLSFGFLRPQIRHIVMQLRVVS